jgi:hypothetical protein
MLWSHETCARYSVGQELVPGTLPTKPTCQSAGLLSEVTQMFHIERIENAPGESHDEEELVPPAQSNEVLPDN